MSTIKLTTIGLYNYDNTLFEGLTFPDGINKEIAVNEILMRSGEFEVLYPDPVFFKLQIEMWGKKHYRTFSKWVEGLAEEFNPLYNYDRYEEYQDEKRGTDSRTGSSSIASTAAEKEQRSTSKDYSEESAENVANISDATTKTDGSRSQATNEQVSTSSDSENKVSAFDASTYSPKDLNEQSGTQQTAGTVGEVSGTESNSSGNSSTATAKGLVGNDSMSDDSDRSSSSAQSKTEDESRASAESTTHTAHLYGNIGVTTSAQLLKEFLEVERFNIYENIAELFVDDFCIMVY